MDFSGWDEFPSYSELLNAMQRFIFMQRKSTEAIVYVDKHPFFNFNFSDVLFVAFTSVIWMVLREFMTKNILKPLGLRYALTPLNQDKMPESAWRFVITLCSWCCYCYILMLSGDYKFFQKPSTVWEGWNLNESIPNKIYYFYIAQFGFSLHAIYALIFLDTWKKDSNIMVIHHTATVILLYLSFTLRCHNIGCMVYFTHDLSKAFLEFLKVNLYFKVQNNRTVRVHELLANASFLCLIVFWFSGRLYLYPLRVLFMALPDQVPPSVPCIAVMNSFLWILLIINIYWTFLILLVLYRVITGHHLEDNREYENEEKLSNKKK